MQNAGNNENGPIMKLNLYIFYSILNFYIVLCIYTQRSISIYYRNQRAINHTACTSTAPSSPVTAIPLSERERLKDDF